MDHIPARLRTHLYKKRVKFDFLIIFFYFFKKLISTLTPAQLFGSQVDKKEGD